MNTSHLLFLTFTSIFSITYLSFCDSYEEPSNIASQRIWPNISDNHSFLQWPVPGLQGAGGLDIDFYQKWAKLVNITRKIPYKVAMAGNFTLAQVVVMGAVGALACGSAALIAESILFQHHEKVLGHHLPLHPFRREGVEESLSNRALENIRSARHRHFHKGGKSHHHHHRTHHRKSHVNKRILPRPVIPSRSNYYHHTRYRPHSSSHKIRYDKNNRRLIHVEPQKKSKRSKKRPAPYFTGYSARRGPDYPNANHKNGKIVQSAKQSAKKQ